jgi:ATP-dependent protease ClpP protease subunit
MAFQIAQNSGRRYITIDGILMSHRMSGMLQGEFGGEMDTMFAFWKRVSEMMDRNAADRMGIDLEDYLNLIRDEFWVMGQDAVDKNAADEVVFVKCSQEFIQSKGCPL